MQSLSKRIHKYLIAPVETQYYSKLGTNAYILCLDKDWEILQELIMISQIKILTLEANLEILRGGERVI